MKYKIYDIPQATDLTNLVIGKNAKKVLIVLSDKEYSSHFNFLEKIIGAVSLNLTEDCLICRLPPDAYVKFSNIRNGHSIIKSVLFGIDFQQLGLQIQVQKNIISKFQKTEILSTFSLSELEKDNQKKRVLWASLKSLFQQS